MCPLVIKLFSPSTKFRQGSNNPSEPPLERPVFPVSMRLLRIVSVLIEQFYTLLVRKIYVRFSYLCLLLLVSKCCDQILCAVCKSVFTDAEIYQHSITSTTLTWLRPPRPSHGLRCEIVWFYLVFCVLYVNQSLLITEIYQHSITSTTLTWLRPPRPSHGLRCEIVWIYLVFCVLYVNQSSLMQRYINTLLHRPP